MTIRNRMPTVLLVALVTVSIASAGLIIVEPDAYPAGTDISEVFSGVKLATIGNWPEIDGKVYSRQAYDPALASTGTNVFGHNATGTDLYGKPRNETWVYPRVLLGVQFYDPANIVALDIIGDNNSDFAAVDVYNASGVLIDSAVTPQLTYGEVYRVGFAHPSYDMTFVIASGISSGGSYYAVYLDNLQANVVPEPATILLLGLGGLILRKRPA